MIFERGGIELMPHVILSTLLASHFFKHIVSVGGDKFTRLSTPVAYVEPGRIMATTIKGKLFLCSFSSSIFSKIYNILSIL